MGARISEEFFIVLRAMLVVCCLAAALPAETVRDDWGRKMFEKTEHDFGPVARGAKVEYAFRFENRYEEKVHVASVRSSCGCTQPRIERENVGTHETSSIIAAFNTRDFLGQRSATITVTFDKPYWTEVQLQVSGYVRSDVVLTPGSVELGSVPLGESPQKKLVITYAGRDDWKITRVKSGNPHVVADVVEKSRANGQVRYDLNVQLKPDAPAGYINEQLVLVTNDKKAGEVPVDIAGRVVSHITVSPSVLLLGEVRPGQTVKKQLVIKGVKPFKILDISSEDEGLTFATVPDTAKSVHLAPITFTAGAEPGKKSFKIVVKTDLNEASAECTANVRVVEVAAK